MVKHHPRFFALVIALTMSASALAIPGPAIRITIPFGGQNLNDGASFAVLGNIENDRQRDANGKWPVEYPNVLLEFYFQEVPYNTPSYLINSSTTGVTFPDDKTTTGAFSGTLTAKQLGGFVVWYAVVATGLDQFNNPGLSAEIWELVTSPGK